VMRRDSGRHGRRCHCRNGAARSRGMRPRRSTTQSDTSAWLLPSGCQW